MQKISAKEKGLFKALLKLKTVEESCQFFRDLCTPAEIEAMTDRWQTALLLNQGLSYREISEKTGTSTVTVTRVARCLKYGVGYQRLLERMRKGE